MSERTDPLAATYAEMALTAALVPVIRAEMNSVGLRMYEGPDPRTIAEAVVGGYIARIEHRDGQRRVVLYGAWEIDPAATARYVPKADAA